MIKLDTYQGLVIRLIKALNGNGIEYMFTGALASSYYGKPRTTMDVDIILTVPETELDHLVSVLGEIDLVVSVQDFRKAQGSGYNVVSVEDKLSPFSVDFILLQGSLEKIACTLFGEPTFLQTSESLVRAKLRMIKATIDPEKSAKDKADVRAIIMYSNMNLERVRYYAEIDGTLKIFNSLTK